MLMGSVWGSLGLEILASPVGTQARAVRMPPSAVEGLSDHATCSLHQKPTNILWLGPVLIDSNTSGIRCRNSGICSALVLHITIALDNI